MANNEFDWESLEDVVSTKKTKYKFSEYGKYFNKVASDRYIPKMGSKQLWELRDDSDGKQYLFALYNEAEDVVTGADNLAEFKAIADSGGESVTLAYLNTPIFRFAKATYQFPDGAEKFANYIEDKAKDQDWLKTFMSKAMTKERQASVEKLMQGV